MPDSQDLQAAPADRVARIPCDSTRMVGKASSDFARSPFPTNILAGVRESQDSSVDVQPASQITDIPTRPTNLPKSLSGSWVYMDKDRRIHYLQIYVQMNSVIWLESSLSFYEMQSESWNYTIITPSCLSPEKAKITSQIQEIWSHLRDMGKIQRETWQSNNYLEEPNHPTSMSAGHVQIEPKL